MWKAYEKNKQYVNPFDTAFTMYIPILHVKEVALTRTLVLKAICN